MHGIKFESFAKFDFEFVIVQLFRPWLKHNGLQNPIRVLRCMVNCGSYVRICVFIMSFL